MTALPEGVTGRLLDGHVVARAVRAEIVEALAQRWTRPSPPSLAVVLLGGDSASRTYAESKARACAELGLRCQVHALAELGGDAEAVIARVRAIGADEGVHGVMIEQPLPPGIDFLRLYDAIPADKDVEGMGCASMGLLMLGRPGLVPATPAAVLRILDHYEVALAGRRAVVIGRSNIVGKPLAALLLARDATVVTCHSRTPDLAAETQRADIVVAAVGRPGTVKAHHIRSGAVVVDVGINFEGGRMVGDVDFASVSPRAAAITPVPGGVGPVTTAMLLWNLTHTAIRQVSGQLAR